MLELDLEALAALAGGDGDEVTAEAHVVRPGDPVRLAHVLDAVDPAAKLDAPETTFPGLAGDMAAAGIGRTLRLEGLAVLALADLDATHNEAVRDCQLDGDEIVDMAGPAAFCTPWSQTLNVVLVFHPNPQAGLAEVDRAIRYGTLAVARTLALAAADAEPDEHEVIDLPEVSADLPSVCVILQVASEGLLVDTYLYGRPMEGVVPTVLDPRELLDGALVNGAFDWAAIRNPTYFYQRSSLIRSLLRDHGVRLRFAGVVIALAYLSSATDKARSAMQSATLALGLGADAAIITAFSSGNSHTDVMLAVRACEHAGMRTVAMLCETNGGLTDHVVEADAIISTGNEDELAPGWAPERVLGGTALRAGWEATEGAALPFRSYLGANSQLGDTRLRAAVG